MFFVFEKTDFLANLSISFFNSFPGLSLILFLWILTLFPEREFRITIIILVLTDDSKSLADSTNEIFCLIGGLKLVVARSVILDCS